MSGHGRTGGPHDIWMKKARDGSGRKRTAWPRQTVRASSLPMRSFLCMNVRPSAPGANRSAVRVGQECPTCLLTTGTRKDVGWASTPARGCLSGQENSMDRGSLHGGIRRYGRAGMPNLLGSVAEYCAARRLRLSRRVGLGGLAGALNVVPPRRATKRSRHGGLRPASKGRGKVGWTFLSVPVRRMRTDRLYGSGRNAQPTCRVERARMWGGRPRPPVDA